MQLRVRVLRGVIIGNCQEEQGSESRAYGVKGLGYLACACAGALKRHCMVLVCLRGSVFGFILHKLVLVKY